MVCMSSREPDEAVRYAAAECIGQIGAVDPGKLELEVGDQSGIISSKVEKYSFSSFQLENINMQYAF